MFNKIFHSIFSPIMFLVILISSIYAANHELYSPDHLIKVGFRLKRGVPYYFVEKSGREIVRSSRLGFRFREKINLCSGFKVEKVEYDSIREIWYTVWGEESRIKNYCNIMRIYLEGGRKKGGKLVVEFRAFNDGIGFRYFIPEQRGLEKVNIMDELTEFNFAGNWDCWWIPAYRPQRYEYLYKKTKISEIDTIHTPATIETDIGLYLSIHEAALEKYSSMTLARKGKTGFEVDLVPWSDGVKVKGKLPIKTPWRTIQIADTPGGLITSHLVLNLNEPCKIKDVSWIKTGKYVGIWWEMHIGKSTWELGPKHGATTENTIKYIDFASRYGFKGVLVEGWNVGWEKEWAGAYPSPMNFLKPYPDFDIKKLSEYAKSKGVFLIGHHETGADILNYERQMEDAFKFYEELGIPVVKTGYVGWGRDLPRLNEKGEVVKEWHHSQYMVEHFRKVIEVAAKYHIMIVAHEPIKDTGERRTWPNMMSREGARGQEYNAWSPDGGNPPEHTTVLPFTRLLAGPMDFTPGIFDLTFDEYRPKNRVNTTLAKQLALYVVIYSPFQMAADLPENYEKRLDAFKFIMDVPTDWDETRVLNAKIGDYVTIVRKKKNSDEWYLGSITDEEERSFDLDLKFLKPGIKYVAEIYRDGENADWKTNPYDIIIEKRKVDWNTNLKLYLAPGGGAAIRFKPVDEGE